VLRSDQFDKISAQHHLVDETKQAALCNVNIDECIYLQLKLSLCFPNFVMLGIHVFNEKFDGRYVDLMLLGAE